VPRVSMKVATNVIIKTMIPRTMKSVPVKPALAISPAVPHRSSVAEELSSRSDACFVQFSYASDRSTTIVSHSPLVQTVPDMSSSPTFDSVVTVISWPNNSVVWDVSSTLHESVSNPDEARIIATKTITDWIIIARLGGFCCGGIGAITGAGAIAGAGAIV